MCCVRLFVPPEYCTTHTPCSRDTNFCRQFLQLHQAYSGRVYGFKLANHTKSPLSGSTRTCPWKAALKQDHPVMKTGAFWKMHSCATELHLKHSQYSDSLQAGRSGDRIPVRVTFSAPVQISPGAHAASYKMGTGSVPGVKWLGHGITTHAPHLVLRLKKG
jgi:hypothetical protein